MLELCIDRVSKTYFRAGRKAVALDDVSLRVPPGRLVAVIGGRGAGKTTLLRVAAGLERPDSGHVTAGGRRLDRMSDRELTRMRRGELGCVWNTITPIGRSNVLDLVALPVRLQSGDGRSALVEAERALAAVDAAHFATAGLDELSDGERQLVAVAQALVTKPRVLMLDQPAANLSLVEEKALLNVLGSLARDANVAVLMTARNASEAVAADTVASLSNGRLFVGESPTGREPGNADVLPIDGRRRDAGGGDSGA